jgi:oligopeptide transport system substrate-binding protein
LINEEFRVFLQNRQLKRRTEVFRAGWIGDYQDPFSFLELFHSEHRRNDSGYANETYDRLLARIATERIPARRRNLMVEAERMLLEDQVVLPVYTYVTKRLINPLLKGWAPNVMDAHPSHHMFFVKSETEAAAESRPDIDGEAEAASERSVAPPPAADTSDGLAEDADG